MCLSSSAVLCHRVRFRLFCRVWRADRVCICTSLNIYHLKELMYGAEARDFVLLHGLYSDSGTFGNSGAAVENLHVIDIRRNILDCIAFLVPDTSIAFVMYIYRLGSASDCVNSSKGKALIDCLVPQPWRCFKSVRSVLEFANGVAGGFGYSFR